MAHIPVGSITTFAHGLDHPEGICLAPDGHLYVGGEQGQLYVIEDGIPREVCRTGGFALGLAADAQSNIYMCDTANGCVWQIDPRTGQKNVFSQGDPSAGPLKNVNWGCFDEAGNYYVSESGGWHQSDGYVLKVDLSGTTRVWTREACEFPNGMCLAADGRTLFVLESTTPALVSFEIRDDGSAGPRTVVAQLPDCVPDGVALAADGRFVIACYRPDIILVVDALGSIETLAADPEGTVLAAPTNVVFIGDRLQTMVVPNLGRWHLSRFQLQGLSGQRLFYPDPPRRSNG